MMKKVYCKPSVEIIRVCMETPLLSWSDEKNGDAASVDKEDDEEIEQWSREFRMDYDEFGYEY